MRLVTFCLLLLLIDAGCNNDNFSAYKKLEAKELASGKRNDSLFKGIYLGMPSKDFYVHCWQLNKQGIFTDGENNTAVLYHLNNGELKYKASMNFYPEFKDNKIYKMQAVINYDAWAPWNKGMVIDTLQQDVMRMFAKWYPNSNPFIAIKDKQRGDIYVKADGNRRIIVGKYSDLRLKIDFTDLLVEKKLPE